MQPAAADGIQNSEVLTLEYGVRTFCFSDGSLTKPLRLKLMAQGFFCIQPSVTWF